MEIETLNLILSFVAGCVWVASFIWFKNKA